MTEIKEKKDLVRKSSREKKLGYLERIGEWALAANKLKEDGNNIKGEKKTVRDICSKIKK